MRLLMRLCSFLILLIFFSTDAWGQDIQSLYESALRSVESGQDAEALVALSKVKASDHELAASAAYQRGAILFKKGEYEKAKDEFQFVLDKSQNAELDEKAEAFIGEVIKAQSAGNEKRWFLSSVLAYQYDSNILFGPDDSSLGDGGGRGLIVGKGIYKIWGNKEHEIYGQANLVYMRSFESEFGRADPTLLGVSAPYVYKTKLFGLTARYDVELGFETLWLDANVDSSRENVMSSGVLKTSLSLVSSEHYYHSYSLNFRSDNFALSIDDEDDDLSALKTSLSTTQTAVINKNRKQLLAATLGMTANNSKGKNNQYRRAEISISHALSLPFWELSLSKQVAFQSVDYYNRDDDRQDYNATFTVSLARPINKWLSGFLSGAITTNDSNVADNEYSKHTVLLGFSTNHAL